MPTPVKYKCKKCNGETDEPNTDCIPCTYKALMKELRGGKVMPREYHNE